MTMTEAERQKCYKLSRRIVEVLVDANADTESSMHVLSILLCEEILEHDNPLKALCDCFAKMRSYVVDPTRLRVDADGYAYGRTKGWPQ
jgi:hypothetical protein